MSPTMQASSGESSMLGKSVDPQRQRSELKAKMFQQQINQLKQFILDRNTRTARRLYEDPNLMELQSMQTPANKGKEKKISFGFEGNK